MTSSSSSSSPLPSPSSSPTTDEDLDIILERITQAKQAIAQWQESLDSALDRLAQMVQDGQAEPSLTYNDFAIKQLVRTSYSFPADHPITLQERQLKTNRELAIALGEATVKKTPYFRVTHL